VGGFAAGRAGGSAVEGWADLRRAGRARICGGNRRADCNILLGRARLMEREPVTPRQRRSLYERQLSARRWVWSNLTDEAVLVYRRSAQGKDRLRVTLVEIFLFLREIVREFLKVGGTTRAASLAFTTLISLIPFVLAFSYLIRSYFNDIYPNFKSQLDVFFNVIMPYQSAQIAAHVNRFHENASTASTVGGVIFFLVAFRLFMAVEATINVIWKVPSDRSYRKKIRSFTMMIFWGPLLIALSFTTQMSVQRNPYVGSFIQNPLVGDLGVLILMFIGFTMLFWLVPSTRVNIRAAALGAAVTAILFQLVRKGFAAYAHNLFEGNLNVIYGAFGLVIIFLLALELMWVLILLGVEVSYVFQNLRGILRAAEQQLEDDPKLDVFFALRAMIEIARRFDAREEAPSSYRLAEDSGATDRQMLGILRRMEDAQLVKEIGGDWTGFVPGGDADRITVDEVIRCIEGAERRIPDADPRDSATAMIARIFGTLDACTREAMGAQTIGRIVRELYGAAGPSRTADRAPA
jgi:membrane protein